MSDAAPYEAFSPAEISAGKVEGIISQHAEEAAFLWQLRDFAVSAPHYKLKDLAKLDERLEAHLDGLRIAGDKGWEIYKKALAEGGPGEAFAASILAFESGQVERLQTLLELVAAKPERLRGVISALAWLPWANVEMYIRQLAAKSQPAFWRRAGIAAAALQRQNLGAPLQDALATAELPVRARAIQAVGELGLVAHLPSVRRHLTSPDHAVRFASAWTTARLQNDAEAVGVLRAFAQSQSAYGDQAVLLAAQRLEAREGQRWRERLLVEPHSCRRAILAAGACGDPEAVPFLIDTMKSPGLARLAGEAFTMITGADLAELDLEGQAPEEAAPAENPDDGNLPWPAPGAIRCWWQLHQAGFTRGTRYLLGKPITSSWLREVLRIGKQRQRTNAALELAILQPNQPLFETRMPASRQEAMLTE